MPPTSRTLLTLLAKYPTGVDRTIASSLMFAKPATVTRAGKGLSKAGLARQASGAWHITDAGRAALVST